MSNGIIGNMDNKIERCYKCGNPGEYWDWANGILVSACKLHISLEASS